MDRKWMFASRLSKEYEDGVKEFRRFAVEHAKNPSRIICPCLQCCHLKVVNVDELEEHLICNGIDKSYSCWTKHGENRKNHINNDFHHNTSYTLKETDTTYELDEVEENVNVIEEDMQDCPHMFDSLTTDAKTPLYNGCTSFTRLSAVLKLFNLKARNGWSNTSFTELLSLIKDMLPQDNVLPSRMYDARKMLSSIGMSYEKIHAYPNDCILFRNEYAPLDKCPKCMTSRYKKNLVASKVVWYFPIIPRFRHMYRNEQDAKNLRWHADQRIRDGKLRHPADSSQWAKVDHDYPYFGKEPRNLRLSLSTDGINPHGMQSNSHSAWPEAHDVIHVIPGPNQPGNDIDIYLAPLIEDLKDMWNEGVEVYDGYTKESFLLRAMLFGTINDFLTYGNLSGYSIKGNVHALYVKIIHIGFLPPKHRYQGWRKAFNGMVEERRAPELLYGDKVFEKVKDINIKFCKPFARDLVTSGWKKKSIFFDLPYWKSLYVRHFLDVMHIEKNIFDSVIGTLLNVPGKSKDDIKARLNLVQMRIQTELAPIKKGKRQYLPPTAHTLSRKEKVVFCKFLQGVKVPQGYSSNIRNLVSMKDLKLIGLKSHDCHVVMEHLLPIAIRSILPKKVRWTITKLCYFFRAICSKVIDTGKLQALEREIIVTLCELKMYFPPSFFDVMVHVTIHLVKETQYCGPAYMRWMYPMERYMKILKGYVKNRSRPEGCIDFQNSRHLARTIGEEISGNTIVTISRKDWEQAQLYILHNDDEVEPYVERHKDMITKLNPTRTDQWICLKEIWDEHKMDSVALKQTAAASLGFTITETHGAFWVLKSDCCLRSFLACAFHLKKKNTLRARFQGDRKRDKHLGLGLLEGLKHVLTGGAGKGDRADRIDREDARTKVSSRLRFQASCVLNRTSERRRKERARRGTKVERKKKKKEEKFWKLEEEKSLNHTHCSSTKEVELALVLDKVANRREQLPRGDVTPKKPEPAVISGGVQPEPNIMWWCAIGTEYMTWSKKPLLTSTLIAGGFFPSDERGSGALAAVAH
ncbi:hypothetical protein V8G54_026796 [Vigna mungo]|uniref:Transposase n=1 Tax=Vigna mungo TaxID=3915 RepID=A0AAQ3N1C2_VIGMU